MKTWSTVAFEPPAIGVPFGGGGTKGRRNPLKIDGPKSIYKNRAVKDKKFPRFGGPDAVFVKIKEKCKKFPYCNQGDIKALNIYKNESLKDSDPIICAQAIKRVLTEQKKRDPSFLLFLTFEYTYLNRSLKGPFYIDFINENW